VTHLRFGGIFCDSMIRNVLLIQKVKKFENQSIFNEVKAYEVKAYSYSPVFGPTCKLN